MYKVLVIEADSAVAEHIACLLAEHKDSVQFDVHVASNGVGAIDAGLAMLAEDKYHLVLLGLNGNDRDRSVFNKVFLACNIGLGTSTEIRTPVVVLTNENAPEPPCVMRRGASDFIAQPIVDAKEFIRRLHVAILRVPYKKTEELHECMARTIAEGIKVSTAKCHTKVE